MKRPVTAKAFGSPATLEALMRRLDAAPEHQGWRRETFGLPPLPRTPNALVFEAPPGRFADLTEAQPIHVSLWRDAKQGEVEVTAVHVDGLPPERPGYAPLHDAVVQAFAAAVLGPAAEAVDAALCMTGPEVRLGDLVSPGVADMLQAFAESEVRNASLHPDDEVHFLRVVASLHQTHTDLDGDTLAQWLFEDVGWPASLTSRLARDLDRGRALLRAYDGLRAAWDRALLEPQDDDDHDDEHVGQEAP